MTKEEKEKIKEEYFDKEMDIMHELFFDAIQELIAHRHLDLYTKYWGIYDEEEKEEKEEKERKAKLN